MQINDSKKIRAKREKIKQNWQVKSRNGTKRGKDGQVKWVQKGD